MTSKLEFLYTLKAKRPEMLIAGPTKEEEQSLSRHSSYLHDLVASGRVVLFGRTQNADETTFGLVILEADSEAEAAQIMAQDPAIAEGVMAGALFPYRIVQMRSQQALSDAASERRAASCLACERDSEAVPLLSFEFRGEKRWICPQHLPVLIHDPTQLIGMLPGAEQLEPADHHD